MSGNGVTGTLDALALEIQNKARIEKAGTQAADCIRSHIYDGNGLMPLSAATVAYRGRGQPLQDSGSLRDSITSEAKGTDAAVVGTTKIYAPIQNNGGTITAKKSWLFIPAKGTRQLERRYGGKPKAVLDGLRADGYAVFRIGRTVCYRKHRKNAKTHVAYYLKKSVVIPARRFWYLTESEVSQIAQEVFPDV